jgi:hypothetical protein
MRVNGARGFDLISDVLPFGPVVWLVECGRE